MKNNILEIELASENVQWAARAAQSSFAKWESRQGYYNNRMGSHFIGKLGELAVEEFLLSQNLKLDSHFRFSDRENLSDIVVKINRYKKISRIEVKTWSHAYWQELGRCVSVDQYPVLKNKTDLIVWCLVHEIDAKEMLGHPQPVKVMLAGWSKIEDVLNAPIKLTGLDNMRKVNNYQLAESDLHDMSSFSGAIL